MAGHGYCWISPRLFAPITRITMKTAITNSFLTFIFLLHTFERSITARKQRCNRL